MRPVLFNLHLASENLALHSYGLAIAAGFLIAIFLGARQARRVGEDPGMVQELCFWLLVSSMVGARLLFVVTNVPSYVTTCTDGIHTHSMSAALWACSKPLHVWEGGLVFYGGFLAACGFAVWYTRRKKMPFARTADVLAPSVAIGHFFGRLGCYAAGCCWGTATSLPLGVRFPSESLVFQQLVSEGKLSPAAQLTPPLHPVQLYEALGELALYFVLSWFAPRKRYDGQVLVGWLLGYGILRFAVEVFRGDDVRRFVLPGLSTSQAIALLTLPLAIALSIWFKRRQAGFSRV
jgi:phosphatidylglycerol:prolipoprotein diacylglycerol transferase